MIAHTPGPWTKEHFAGATSISGMMGGRAERTLRQFAEVRNFLPSPTASERAEIDANADLIAAAPELRDAVEAAIDEFAIGSFNAARRQRVVEFLRAALAKAEGRS